MVIIGFILLVTDRQRLNDFSHKRSTISWIYVRYFLCQLRIKCQSALSDNVLVNFKVMNLCFIINGEKRIICTGNTRYVFIDNW